MEENLLISNILSTDGYKFGHYMQYPKGTTSMYSYFESRGGRFDKTVFFGLQYYLKRYLTRKITVEQVEEAKIFAKSYGVNFNYEGWMHVAKDLDGKLPIRIKAVKEGSIIPTHNILLSVESTDEKTFWVVSWFETLLVNLWYPVTIATSSYNMKKDLMEHLEKSSDNPNVEIDFKLHDFGARGATCIEQAMIGGASHEIPFKGSDTTAGTWMANQYYNCEMSGFSINASEHSTISMLGVNGEVEQMRRMIQQYGDENIFACVSDTYDYENAVRNIWGKELFDDIYKMKAMLVIRPDSGDPVEMILKGLSISEECGHTFKTNSKGYKVFDKLRFIQGDGINRADMNKICKAVIKAGYSMTNVGFGMGGSLLQRDFHRDTNRFAFKCSSATINGKEVEVYKKPITDIGKKSKRGKMDLVNYDGNVRTVFDGVDKDKSIMETVFENGEILKEYTFEEIREQSKKTPYGQHTGWVERPVEV